MKPAADALSSEPKTARQTRLQRRVVAVLRESATCRGAALADSFARGMVDRVSDLDLVVFVDDGFNGVQWLGRGEVSETKNLICKPAAAIGPAA